MALFTRFLGRTASEGAAFALGAATAPVLAPAVEELKNEAWRTHPSRTLGPNDAAEIVAEDVERRDWGADESSAHGIDGVRFDALVGAVLNAPGMGDLLQARRRGLISEARFRHGLRKARLESLWDDALVGLLDVLLTPAELANAVVQGHMAQDAAAAQAELQGISRERFDVLVQNTGLPPGPETLSAWRRRGIIDDAQLDQGIREGHTKTKYIPFFHAALKPVLHATEYANLWLRGWITNAERDEGGALTGYTPEQMDLLSKDRGRPATTHQVHVGFARGGRLAGAGNNERATFSRAVKESNIRPEWEEILWAQRYSYPSAFVLRSLVQAGNITRDEGEQALLFSGWEPTFAAKVADAWAQGGSGTTADPNVTKAHNQLWTATHRSYIIQEIDRAEAETALARFVTDAQARSAVLDTWDAERAVTIKSLTPSQVKSAYTQAVIPLDTALAELTRLGYDQESAARLLGTVQPVVSIPAIMAGVEADVRAGVVDAVEAIARLTAVGVKPSDAAALVQTWEGG